LDSNGEIASCLEELRDIAPRRQGSSTLALRSSWLAAPLLLAATAGQENAQPKLPTPRTAPATGTTTSQIQNQQILLHHLQTTMASKGENRRPLLRNRSALPLATTAGQESFNIAERTRKSRGRNHQIIGEDGDADAPASLQPQEKKKQQPP
jgi:hypothetical protein